MRLELQVNLEGSKRKGLGVPLANLTLRLPRVRAWGNVSSASRVTREG